ncbi:MAG: class I SAM-dependent methyltransferase [Dehalococcoidia bacterium]
MTIQESAGNSYARWLDGRARLVAGALKDIPNVPGGLTLDVAAGDGGYSAMVAAALGTRLVTHDMSAGECRAAHAAGRSAVRGDALRLPFADACADVTVAFEIIEHFDAWNAGALLREIARVTKPGGHVLLSTPNRYSLESWKGIARYVRDGTVWNARDDTHVRLLSRRSLLKTVGSALEVERCLGYYLVPELRGRATGWTHVISSNPVAAGLCHKLLVVALKP